MLLTIIISLLLVNIILILACELYGVSHRIIQNFTLFFSLICLFISVTFLIFFDRTSTSYQYLSINNLNIGEWESYHYITAFGIDGVSLFFVLLSTLLVPLCLLTSWKKDFELISDYCFYFIMLEIFLILSFSALDIITFFVFFESILIPMFFIIGIWGSRHRRVRAVFLFFLYTLLGSVFLFFSLLIIYYDTGTTSFSILAKIDVSLEKQLIVWLFIFFAFSVKIPTVPVHSWLPEAHVEAPTAGSVILAGLLLKLGGYGFLRVLLPVLTEATTFYLPLVDTLALASIVYASLTTIRQVDLKRIIAYSSVAHMNLVVLGLFSGVSQGISGAVFLMLAHGIVSSGLFFLVGVLYDKYQTRLLYYYGGLVQTMPIFSTQLLVLCLANTGLPGTCNFIGELMVFVGLVDRNFLVAVVAVTGVILSVIYSIFLYNRLAFGNVNYNYIKVYEDINQREMAVMWPLLLLAILLGLYPNIVIGSVIPAVDLIVEKSKYL